jgi:hypothetical protein
MNAPKQVPAMRIRSTVPPQVPKPHNPLAGTQVKQLPDAKRQNATLLLHLQALKLLSFSRTPTKEARGRCSFSAFIYSWLERRNPNYSLNVGAW